MSAQLQGMRFKMDEFYFDEKCDLMNWYNDYDSIEEIKNECPITGGAF